MIQKRHPKTQKGQVRMRTSTSLVMVFPIFRLDKTGTLLKSEASTYALAVRRRVPAAAGLNRADET